MKLLHKHTIEDADAPITQWWLFKCRSGAGIALVRYGVRDFKKKMHTFQTQEYDAWSLVIWGSLLYCTLNWDQTIDIDDWIFDCLPRKTVKHARVQFKADSPVWCVMYQQPNQKDDK